MTSRSALPGCPRTRLLVAVALLTAAGCHARPAPELRPAPPPPPPPTASAPPSVSAVSEVRPEASASASAAPPASERVVSTSGRTTAWVGPDRGLWVKDASGERRLVASDTMRVANADANLPAVEGEPFEALSFSPDEARVYFVRGGWATSRALFYAEVNTGQVFFFHDMNDYQVISSCKDRAHVGRVITFEHSYFDIVPGSAADLFFLVDSAQPRAGESRTGGSGRVGTIGFDESSRARFLASVCGVGKAPARPPAEVIPPAMRGATVRCHGEVLRRRDLRLLDGTSEVRFEVGGSKDEPPEVLTLADATARCAPR